MKIGRYRFLLIVLNKNCFFFLLQRIRFKVNGRELGNCGGEGIGKRGTFTLEKKTQKKKKQEFVGYVLENRWPS